MQLFMLDRKLPWLIGEIQIIVQILKRVGVTCLDTHQEKVYDHENLEDILAIATLITGSNLLILVWFVWRLT